MSKKQIALKYFINISAIIVGTFIMGIAFSVFLSPNKISPTGFSGIASLISNLVLDKTGFYLAPSILYLVMNAILFAVAFKTMGFEFIILSITGVASYSLAMWVCGFIEINVGNDLLLCAIYGGLLMGVGAGIVLRFGGSTGGGDTIACMLKHSHVKVTTGQIIIIIDTIIIIGSCFAYGISYGMYAIITCFLMGHACDIVINGVKGTRAYYIVTNKPQEVYDEIIRHVHRGVTEIKATGMYTHKDRAILICLLSRSEVANLKRSVRASDPNAFMYSIDVKEAIGVGFEPMRKQTEKQLQSKDAEKVSVMSSPNNIEQNINSVEIEKTGVDCIKDCATTQKKGKENNKKVVTIPKTKDNKRAKLAK